jgi:hypothetical protein
MKKKLALTLIMVTLLAGGVFAQDWYNSYAPGIDGSILFINAGVGSGFLPSYSLPPIYASVEYAGLPIPLSVGGYFGIAEYKQDTSDFNIHDTPIVLGARAAWHFNLLENLDAYAAVHIGWMMGKEIKEGKKTSLPDITTPFSTFDYGFFIGARYFFTSFLGAFLELGYSPITFGTVGLALKF